MVKKKDAFIKKHLTPDDLDGKSVNITIKNVAQVSVFDYKQQAKVMKWAMFFNTTTKYMILNETNWDLLTEIFGSDDSEDWLGNKVVIFVEDILVGGQPKKALRFTDSPDAQTVEKAQITEEEAGQIAKDQVVDALVGSGNFKEAETEKELRERLSREATEKNAADKETVNNNVW